MGRHGFGGALLAKVLRECASNRQRTPQTVVVHNESEEESEEEEGEEEGGKRCQKDGRCGIEAVFRLSPELPWPCLSCAGGICTWV